MKDIGGISFAQLGAIERNAPFVINEGNTIDASAFILSDYHTQALFLQSLSESFLSIWRSTHNSQYLPSNGWYQWLDGLLRFLHPVLHGSIAHTTADVRGMDGRACLVALAISWNIDQSIVFLSPKLRLHFFHGKIVCGKDGVQLSQ